MEYKYTPKTKAQLIAAIRAEIKEQGTRANLNCIDTSAITNMYELFSKFKTFNGDISLWNVGNVTDMSWMFYDSQFNGDISQWDVSNVKNMEYMFQHSSFDGDISGWNVDNVESFFPIFGGYSSFKEEHKPMRFRRERDESFPVLKGKKNISDDAMVEFSLTGDGVLRISGNLKYNYKDDPYYLIDCKSLPVKRLIIEEGVTEIGDYMFYGWSQITEVTFPGSLRRIGSYAFDGCSNIAVINFAEGLEELGDHAFSSCAAPDVHLPDTLKSIGSGVFSRFSLLREIVLPDSVETIGSCCFMGCESLRSVKLPMCLKTIEESTFEECRTLETVVMPQQIEKIGRNTFSKCPNLQYVELPGTIEEIGEDAFPTRMFSEDVLNYYIVNYNTSRSECRVCSGKAINGALNIPSEISYEGKLYKVTELDNGAFEGCERLKEISIPDTVKEIPLSAFNECWRLRKVRLGTYTTRICDEAFKGCEFLQHIEIPDSVKEIRWSAFEDCKNLIDINMPSSLTCLSLYALEGTPLVKQKGPVYIDNVLCGKGTGLPANACLVVRDGTTVVGEAAFRGSSIKALIFPEGLKHIGYEAFESCSNLEYVHLPKSLENIGEGAFNNSVLKEVSVPWETPIEVDYATFPSETVVYIPEGSLEKYKAAKYWRSYKLVEKPMPVDWVPTCDFSQYDVIRDEKPERHVLPSFRKVLPHKP